MGHFKTAPAGTGSGIKVLDRAVDILSTVAAGPCSLAQLCEFTELPRATAHRLATALESHNYLSRTTDGKWTIGKALLELATHGADGLVDAASPIMTMLMDQTGESVQLYRLHGQVRTCIASIEPPSGLQNTVPIGSQMELTAGSAAKVFMAYASEALANAIMPQATFTERDLELVRARGWAESVAEREAGLASLSAPVFTGDVMVAALSISGPAGRLSPSPGAKWSPQITAAAQRLTNTISRPSR